MHYKSKPHEWKETKLGHQQQKLEIPKDQKIKKHKQQNVDA